MAMNSPKFISFYSKSTTSSPLAAYFQSVDEMIGRDDYTEPQSRFANDLLSAISRLPPASVD
ncbi:hypothetical protein EGR_11012 [Echinococcus granulosus]|uniref:Uncharacterized protein n=1 Tax=Echinococcus granulosus TaxID=6210 RepID=W6U0Z3_ECHGR|nr:hypothetical protein EGR_11012 [Echinococcus granulosus]EUB54131.1 hypothetical protein EGR_11012 [Echinococcus granulosus]